MTRDEQITELMTRGLLARERLHLAWQTRDQAERYYDVALQQYHREHEAIETELRKIRLAEEAK